MATLPPAGYRAAIRTAADTIGDCLTLQPKIAMILGSGLGAFAETIDGATRIPYEQIPGWPQSTVEGHSGQLVVGEHAGMAVAVMQGRAHLYEGYEPWKVVFPVRVLAALGCHSLVVTNAAGAINTDFAAGDLMLINDHVNMQGTNACIGRNFEELGPRFFDMSYAYDRRYQQLARDAAQRCGIELREGVYAAMLGPAYETPAEIRMLTAIGVDAVGMSTVPEVTAANHMGLRVVGISCLSNMAAGVLDQPLDHEEVMQTGERVRGDFIRLVQDLVESMSTADRS
jgi:purine-nucleoside phosphorylase